jgi:hypothetical protein
LARLAGLCKTLSPRRRAVTAQAPAYERLALPAGGTADREYEALLEETGLSR